MKVQQRILLIAMAVGMLGIARADRELKLGETTDGQSLSSDQKGYYFFIVPANMSAKQNYLIFDVSGIGEKPSDPDILISSVRVSRSAICKSFL